MHASDICFALAAFGVLSVLMFHWRGHNRKRICLIFALTCKSGQEYSPTTCMSSVDRGFRGEGCKQVAILLGGHIVGVSR